MSTEKGNIGVIDQSLDHLKLDEGTAKVLAKTGTKVKPRGFSRGLQMEKDFIIENQIGNTGDYLMLAPDGTVSIETQDFVETHFEPVAKRTRKPKGE